jgi:hypothetical protein
LLQARGRFHPARDRQGRAIPAYAQQQVRWTLPKGNAPVAFRSGYSVVVIPGGGHAIAGCTLWASHNTLLPLADDVCADLLPEAETEQQQMSAIMLVKAEQVPPPAPPPLPGVLVHRETASFQVGADGRVGACRERVERSGREPFGLCGFLSASGESYFMSSPGSRVRRGELTLEIRNVERD